VAVRADEGKIRAQAVKGQGVHTAHPASTGSRTGARRVTRTPAPTAVATVAGSPFATASAKLLSAEAVVFTTGKVACAAALAFFTAASTSMPESLSSFTTTCAPFSTSGLATFIVVRAASATYGVAAST